MSTKIEFVQNTTDVRVCYSNNRAIATIVKQEDGKYRVVKLYDQYVKDFDSYNEARQEALSSSVVRAENVVKFGPRKNKKQAEAVVA